MSVLSIEVEVLVGTDIADAVDEAIALCNKLNLAYVNFSFNGLSISIGKNATLKGFMERYDDPLKFDRKYLIVNE